MSAMKWLRRSAGDGEPSPVEIALPEAPPPATEIPAPGLKHALGHLPRSGARVLDLGAALAANVAFFNGLGARLRIADLDASIDEAGLREAPAAAWERGADELLALPESESYDLVLAWDLPNYVGRDRWPALVKRITAHLAPMGAVHLMVRVGQTMPARPCRFRIVEAGKLLEDALVAETVPAPRLPHAEVEKLHPGLVAPRSHLGKLGVQEYVLEHAERHHLPPRRVAQPRQRRAGTSPVRGS